MNALLRLLFVALVLGFAVHASAARAKADQATARATVRTQTEPVAAGQDEFPLGGLLIIAGIVGAMIVLAWVASRVGDSRRSDTVD